MPLVPGTEETVDSFQDADDIALKLGYPVIIKAVAGGGGRGIAIVQRREDLEQAYKTTRETAQQLFKNSGVYMEKCIQKFRHCEVQLLCDNFGNGVHLGERDWFGAAAAAEVDRGARPITFPRTAKESVRDGVQGPWQPATPAPGPSSSSSIPTAIFTLWRLTPASRSSIRCPR